MINLTKPEGRLMMVKSHTYRLIALSLAWLLMATSVGFSLDVHICRGKVRSFSFYGQARGCNELMPAATTCAHHERRWQQSEGPGSPLIERLPCCQNRQTLHQITDSRVFTDVLASGCHQSQDILTAPAVGIHLVSLPGEPYFDRRYKPPLIIRRIPLLDLALLF